MNGKYRLSTLGCKVNQYESQQLRELCESLGYLPAQLDEAADIAIVNTCAVTNTALSKSRQETRRLTHGGRTAVIVVGCGATADAERIRNIQGVSAVVGHDGDALNEVRKILVSLPADERSQLSTSHKAGDQAHANRSAAGENELWMMQDHQAVTRLAADTPSALKPQGIISKGLPIVKEDKFLHGRIERFEGHQRAFLKVQDGCDAFCTYCIIPQLRSSLQSKPIEQAVAEARRLVESGHKEIIITGIFLGAFGRDTAIRKRFASTESPLASLVRALSQVDGLKRLRLSSLEPGDVDSALLEVIATSEVCVPHLHLPLQSGSAEILRRMNRQYTRDEFLNMIERVNAALDRPAITTDIIVGFPGEAEEDFMASMEMARHAEFLKIHAFPFSPRDKTAAARWQREFIPKAIARERMQRLAEVERECSRNYRQRAIGQIERVLVEGNEANQTGELCQGRTDRYFRLFFESRNAKPGDIVNIRVDRVTPTRTHGTHLPARTSQIPLCVLSS